MLAHPIEKKPYRLYTDASKAGGSAILQQVQPIRVGDLKSTKIYDYLQKCFEKKETPRLLFVKLIEQEETPEPSKLTEPFEENVVHVERVIAVYARTWSKHEKNLSITEMEALALKDRCIKFHSLIEGEEILAVTNHEAIKWAVTNFDVRNRKLQSWNAIFSAFRLTVVHRPGKAFGDADYMSRFFASEAVQKSTVVPGRTDATMDDVGHIDLQPKEHDSERSMAPFNPDVERVLEAHKVPDPFMGLRAVNQEDVALARMVVETPSLFASRSQPSRGGKSVAAKPAAPVVVEDPMPDEEEGQVNLYVDSELRKRLVRESELDPWIKRRLVQLDEAKVETLHPLRRDKFGLLYLEDHGRYRLCVPKGCQAEVLAVLHDSPYLGARAGVARTMSLVMKSYFWVGMRIDIEKFVNACPTCQSTKTDGSGKKGAMKPLDIPQLPGDCISLDFIVGLPPVEVDSVLVVVDRLTRLAFFIPTTATVTATESATLLIEHVFTRLGFPLILVGDRDPRWTALPFQEIARELGLKLSLSTAHHPQTDGMTEALNKWLEVALRAYTAELEFSWAEKLPALAFAYNGLTHGSTRASPFQLLQGYEPRNPAAQVLESPLFGYRDRESEEFMASLSSEREIARSSIALAQGHQARYYNQHRREETFKVGDEVLIHPFSAKLQVKRKLADRWAGPFTVSKVISPLAYRLKLGGEYERVHPVISIAHLKRFTRADADMGKRVLRTPARPDLLPGEYETEAILTHEYRKDARGRWQPWFFVKFVGYEEPEFCQAEWMRNSEELLEEYQASPEHARAEEVARQEKLEREAREKERREKGANPDKARGKWKSGQEPDKGLRRLQRSQG